MAGSPRKLLTLAVAAMIMVVAIMNQASGCPLPSIEPCWKHLTGEGPMEACYIQFIKPLRVQKLNRPFSNIIPHSQFSIWAEITTIKHFLRYPAFFGVQENSMIGVMQS